MRMYGGQVIGGTAFSDSMAFNDLWQRVTPDDRDPPTHHDPRQLTRINRSPSPGRADAGPRLECSLCSVASRS